MKLRFQVRQKNPLLRGSKSRKVEKELRGKLGAEWKWNTLIIECFDKEDRKTYQDAQKIVERQILNGLHASFPCGGRTSYLSHDQVGGSALDSKRPALRDCAKDLNLLYKIFEETIGFRPSIEGNSKINISPEQMTALQTRTGFDEWFLKQWLRRPKDKYGVIKG